MNKKRISLLLLVFVLIVSTLVACGKGGSNESSIVGKWKVTKIEMSGVSMDLDEFSKQYGQEIEITMTFDKDGKVTMDMMGEEESAEYTLSGTKLTIDGTAAAYDGKTIVIEEASMNAKMTLEKA